MGHLNNHLRQYLNRFCLIGLSITLAACQSQGPVSLEEAKSITASFERPYFEPPKRHIDDLKSDFGPLRKAPQNCVDARAFRADSSVAIRQASDISRSGGMAMQPLLSFLDRVVTRGNYKDADGTIEEVLNNLPSRRQAYRRGALYGKLVRLRAATGALSDAKDALSNQSLNWGKFTSSNEITQFRYDFDLARNRADIAYYSGEYQTAELHYRTAMEAARRAFGTRTLHRELGDTLLKQGHLMEAEAMARTAINAGWGLSENYSSATARAVSLMAAIKLEQGKLDDAADLARIAVNMHEFSCVEPDAASYAIDRRRLAQILVAQKKWSDSLSLFEVIERDLSGNKNALANLMGGNSDRALAMLKTGNPDGAFRRIQDDLTDSIQRYGENSLNVLELKAFIAVLYMELGDQAKALNEFSNSVPKLLSSANSGQDSAGGLTRRSRLKLILESYFRLLLDIQGTDLEKSAGLNAASEAFLVANATRGQKIQAALSAASARAHIPSPELAELVRREQDAHHQVLSVGEIIQNLEMAPPGQSDPQTIRKLRGHSAELQAARLVLLDEINRQFPEYADLINPAPASLGDARKFMLDNETLIATIAVDGKTYVWAVPKTGKIAFSRIDMTESELTETVDKLRKAVDPGAIASLDDIPAFDVASAHNLFKEILEPVRAGWINADTILYVPHGPLGRLPISMLPTTMSELAAGGIRFSGYRNVNWLANSHAVAILPSVESLKALRSFKKKSAKRQAFIGFGDPYFNFSQAKNGDRQQASSQLAQTRGIRLRSRPQTRSVSTADLGLLPRLPETGSELLSIAESLGVDPKGSVFIGRDANEARVKSMNLEPFRVLAFATHGLVPGDLDGLDQPALAMTLPGLSKTKGDGLLTMEEILGLRLNANWVVLSACNTASGDGQGAEAVSGLGRAFFYAGTRALLVSHWPVHSGATQDLTTTLFRLQSKSKTLGRARALQQTRLHLIKGGTFKGKNGRDLFSYAHPLFWAPFTIVGDGGL